MRARPAEIAAVAVKLALSMLCENPDRRTGLSTLFPEFVGHARRLFPNVHWLLFAGARQPAEPEEGVEISRAFPGNEHRGARLFADHFGVGPEALRRGADALLTIGFVPWRTAGLPIVMHVFSVPGGGSAGEGGTGGKGLNGALRNRYRGWAIRRGLNRARLVITNSPWTASALTAASGRIFVSPEGVRCDLFHPPDPQASPGTYLLWASNFYRYKRAEWTLRAYAGLPVATRARLPLLLAGGNWEGGRDRAEAEAIRLGIAADVRFLGWVGDAELPGLYRGARALVSSTASETFGRHVLEAMASGCPCVLQDLPVLREVTGGAAVFTDFANTAAATAALESVVNDNVLAERLRLGGRSRAEAFSYDRLARERVTAILAALGRAA